jgi:hypothetical protein
VQLLGGGQLTVAVAVAVAVVARCHGTHRAKPTQRVNPNVCMGDSRTDERNPARASAAKNLRIFQLPRPDPGLSPPMAQHHRALEAPG